MVSNGMTFKKALGIGFWVAFVTTVVGTVVAFIGQWDLSVPGVVEIFSPRAGAPSTEILFSLLAPVLLMLLVAVTALLLRAPFLVVVILAAATAATLRALGWG